MLAAHDDIAVRRDRKVKRTEFGVSHLPRWQHPAIGIERENGVTAFSARSNAGGEKEPAIKPKRKAARKRNDVRRKDKFACAVELARKRHYGALAAQTDIIPAVRHKIAAARL